MSKLPPTVAHEQLIYARGSFAYTQLDGKWVICERRSDGRWHTQEHVYSQGAARGGVEENCRKQAREQSNALGQLFSQWVPEGIDTERLIAALQNSTLPDVVGDVVAHITEQL
jgi:hypothetical protein